VRKRRSKHCGRRVHSKVLEDSKTTVIEDYLQIVERFAYFVEKRRIQTRGLWNEVHVETWAVYEVANPLSNIGDGVVLRLFHGTRLSRVLSMFVDNELIASRGGLLGPGVYLGTWEKAKVYGDSCGLAYVYDKKTGRSYYDWGSIKDLGAILECDVSLGHTDDPLRSGETYKTAHRWDTRVGRKGLTKSWGGTLKNDEWCVRDPRRVVVRRIHVMLRRT